MPLIRAAEVGLPKSIFNVGRCLESGEGVAAPDFPAAAGWQGLTLVHFSAQLTRFLCDRGCVKGLFRGCLGGVGGYLGVFTVYFVSETTQVELKSGRV